MGCCCSRHKHDDVEGGGVEFSTVQTCTVLKPLLSPKHKVMCGDMEMSDDETVEADDTPTASPVGHAPTETVDFYSCCSGSVVGGGSTTFAASLKGRASREFRTSFCQAAATNDAPHASQQVSIEPVTGRPPNAPPTWLTQGREVVRVRVGGDDPRHFVFNFTGKSFNLEVDGYKIPGKRDFKLLREMALGVEQKPHAEWKSAHVDDKNRVKAWTRAPPDLPWLAPPETMSEKCRVNQVRTEAQFDCPARTLYDVLHDSSYRKVWDDKMLEGRKVADLTPRADIGYYAANLPSPLANRDFCNLRTWLELSTTEYIIMNYSVKHDLCPEQGMVRAVSYGSGYFVQGRSDGSGCTLYSVSHTDMKTSVPAWVINGKIGAISCGIIPKLREAAANYDMYKRLKSLSDTPIWRTPISALDEEANEAEHLQSEERDRRSALTAEETRTRPQLAHCKARLLS